eukprot:906806_1
MESLPQTIQYCNYAAIILTGFPILLHSLRLLFRIWSAKWFERRHKHLSLFILLLLCINLFVLIPLLLHGFKASYWPVAYSTIISILLILSSQWLVLLYAIKVFMLYFDTKYFQALSANNCYIHTCHQIFTKHWFIINKSKYGSVRRVSVITFPCHVICVIIQFALYTKLGSTLVFGGFLLFMFLVLLWIYYRCIISSEIRSLRDTFGIQRELRFVMIKTIISVIGFLTAFGVGSYVDKGVIPLAYSCIIMGHVILGWSVVGLPLVYNERHRTARALYVKDPSGERSKCKEWTEFISTVDGFTAFMNFLQTQYETQYLWFITEYIQLCNILSSHEIFIKEFEKHGFSFRNPNIQLPSRFDRFVIANQFQKRMSKSTSTLTKNELDSQHFGIQGYRRYNRQYLNILAHLMMLSEDSVAASMIHNQFRKSGLHNLSAMHAFIDTVNSLYGKYIASNAPLYVKIDKRLKQHTDQWFKDREELTPQITDNIFIDIVECCQHIFEDINVLLAEAFVRFSSSKHATPFATVNPGAGSRSPCLRSSISKVCQICDPFDCRCGLYSYTTAIMLEQQS